MRRRSLGLQLLSAAGRMFFRSGRRAVLLVGGLCLVLMLGAWTSVAAVFGGLPSEAKDLPEMQEYRAMAGRLAVPAPGGEGLEESHQVTPGLLMALDVLTGNQDRARLEEVAVGLKPEYEYGTVTVEVTDPGSGETREVPVTVLSSVRAYDGEYTYAYSYQVSDGKVVPVVDETRWRQDYSRLKAAIKALTGQEADDSAAMTVAELGKSIDSGRPNLQALVPSFLEGVTYGGVGWPVQGTVTSGYGWRVHPITGEMEFHPGVDIGASLGTPIHAAMAGTVHLAGSYGGYGLCVILDHGDGLQTLYGHCSQLLVSRGQYVEGGQVIALVGSTGVSTGPHVHFEVRQNGVAVDPRTIGF